MEGPRQASPTTACRTSRRASGCRSQGEAISITIRELEKLRCSDLPRRRLKRSTIKFSVWTQLATVSDRLDARTCMSARKHRMSVSVGPRRTRINAPGRCPSDPEAGSYF